MLNLVRLCLVCQTNKMMNANENISAFSFEREENLVRLLKCGNYVLSLLKLRMFPFVFSLKCKNKVDGDLQISFQPDLVSQVPLAFTKKLVILIP